MLRQAFPIYVELLTAVVAVSVIDLLWVSGLGAEAIAAVTIATTTEYLALGLFLAVATGVTVLVGRRDGREPVSPVVRTGWLLWAVVSVAVTVPGVLAREPLAGLFAADAGTAALTAGYYLISLGGLPVYFAQALADAVVKGKGNTKIPMRNALICNVLVIALDPLLIYGLGLGVQGAALATVLARAVTLAVSLRTLVRLAPRDAAGWAGGWEIVGTGLPMSGDFLARAVVGMLMVDVVARFGLAAQAGYGIGLKIMLAGVMAFYALRQAAMIRTARSEPVGSPLRTGLVAGAVVAVVLNAVAAPVAAWFTDDPAVAAEAVGFLRWMPLYLVPFGGLIAIGGVLQASGRGSRVLAATLAGFAAQLPLAYALSFWLGVTGVWLATAAGAVLSLGALTARRGSGRSSAPAPAPPATRTAAGRRPGP
ncbi:MATE family efflux transporter [Thermoactinospora rubra]|uniref:MATE family efflux transporter n=1 Tax=Thermoactinospora rubra TaxID=1088767 RepID=UPI000A0F6778|nr:MATE family efflux transporter [Thermoactinospora rubra]